MAKSMYKLICSIWAHPTGGFRCMSICENGVITAGNEPPNCAKLWILYDGDCVRDVTLTGHDSHVTCACSIKPSDDLELIITGGDDSNVCIYKYGESMPIKKFKAHQNSLCCLSRSNCDRSSFLTSSHDRSVKLWKFSVDDQNEKLESVILNYHSGTPLCVTDLQSGLIVSSCSRYLFIHWRNGEFMRRLEGHDNAIRDLCTFGDNEFLSCDENGYVKHWNVATQECQNQLNDHNGTVLGVSALSKENLAVSCGCDGTVRIWCDGDEEQTVLFPADSVNYVKIFKNTDIASGSSDGMVRIFTCYTDRYSRKNYHKKFEAEARSFRPNFENILDDNQSNQSKKVKLQEDSGYAAEFIKKYGSVLNEDNGNNNNPEESSPTNFTDNQGPVEVAREVTEANSRSLEYMPRDNYSLFNSCDFNCIRETLLEINILPEVQNNCITNEELESLISLSREGIATPESYEVLQRCLRWPDEHHRPILDLMRVAVLHKNVNDELCVREFVLELARKYLDIMTSNFENQALMLVFLTNMFIHDTGRETGLFCKCGILKVIIHLTMNQNNRYFLNVVPEYIINLIIAMSKTRDLELWEEVFDSIYQIIRIVWERNVDLLFEIVVGLGTLFWHLSDPEQSKFSDKVFNTDDVLEMFRIIIRNSFPEKLLEFEERLAGAVRELFYLIG